MPELAKAYEPSAIQDRLYAGWLAKGYYHADPASPKPAFSIVIPPPNITGVLTMGHVLNNTIQDVLARRARMLGKEVLWLPGTDHAGLATQTAVEKFLRKEEKVTRHDLGRDEFLRRIWAWKEKHGGIIIGQLKKLGASCDWERERFTLDPDYGRAVQEVFVALHAKGLIRRGKRMVNWCPGSLTAISDEEVIPKPQTGLLYYVRYEIVDQPGRFLTVATTRPETIPGDVALAVHPRDERYSALVGHAVLPPFSKAPIPVVGDDAIDPKFGTGVLKVTPAHDKVDFEIGRRHGLPAVDVLTPAGKLATPEVPELDGLDRFEARAKAAALLAERGLLEKEEPYANTVGYSERADVPIEPRLSEQWFLDYPKTIEAIAVVKEKLIRFFPSHWEKVYDHWLENIQPWCISRQVWWGHRIPVWYRDGEQKCQIDSPGAGWEQDPDTLDTWFSSWLWAYATMDAPTRAKFYPTDVLVTGPDIIFLWVARMIIAGLEFAPGGTTPEQNIPFRDVYFTGLIRDGKGRKMSKSLGNSPDPLDLIAKYGADGLRFGLMRIAPQGADIRFDEKQIEEGRNFGNKLWNACRFRALQGPIDPRADPSRHQQSPFAQLLFEKVNKTVEAVGEALNKYEFSTAASALYDFVWNDFCAQFIEAAKVDFNRPDSPTRAGTLATIDYTLNRVLRLLHPFVPFLTEELWIQLGFGPETIQFEAWPKPDLIEESIADWSTLTFAENVYETAEKGRRLRGDFNIPSNQKAKFILRPKSELIGDSLAVLATLLNATEVEVIAADLAGAPVAFTPLGDLYLPLTGLVDPAAERARIGKELEKIAKDLDLTEKKLANAEVMSRAPAEKAAEWNAHAASLRENQRRLAEQLQQLPPG